MARHVRCRAGADGGRLRRGEGLAPLAYTLFATALALAGGVVLRRAGLALAFALVVFVGVRVAIVLAVRPDYQPAIQRTWTNAAGPDLRTAWVITQSSGLYDRSGRRPTPAEVGSCIGQDKQPDDAYLGEARHPTASAGRRTSRTAASGASS